LALYVLSSEILDFGEIILQSGKNLACKILVRKALISISVKRGVTNDTTVKNNSFASAANTDGSQSMQLNTKANRKPGHGSGLYKGSCTVVFAFK